MLGVLDMLIIKVLFSMFKRFMCAQLQNPFRSNSSLVNEQYS